MARMALVERLKNVEDLKHSEDTEMFFEWIICGSSHCHILYHIVTFQRSHMDMRGFLNVFPDYSRWRKTWNGYLIPLWPKHSKASGHMSQLVSNNICQKIKRS
jgi:hypothetical protein